MKKTLSVLVLFIVLFTGYCFADVFTNEQAGISFEYPSALKYSSINSQGYRINVLFHSKDRSNKETYFDFSASSLMPRVTMEESIKYLKEEYAKANVENPVVKEIKIPGAKSAFFTKSAVRTGQTATWTITAMGKKYNYTWLFKTPASKASEFEKEILEMVKTIRITG